MVSDQHSNTSSVRFLESHNMVASGAPSAVHQAVDVAFSIADLIGGFLSDTSYRRTLISAADGDSIQLYLDPNNSNQPTFSNTSSTKWGVIHAAQAGPSSVVGDTGIPLAAQCTYLEPNGSAAFPNYPAYTKGLLTATVVDPSQTLARYR